MDIPEALGFIESSVNRMEALIGSILKLSRLGRRDLYPERVDMGELVRGILRTLTYRIQETGAEVTVEPLPEVVADRLTLEQVMANLLANAVNYLDPDRPGRVKIHGRRRPGEVLIQVTDNGRGIEETDMKKIFNIFQRVGHPDVPGEGMGLAYVRTVIRRQGGRVWGRSTPGKGSTFSFTLPARPPEKRSSP